MKIHPWLSRHWHSEPVILSKWNCDQELGLIFQYNLSHLLLGLCWKVFSDIAVGNFWYIFIKNLVYSSRMAHLLCISLTRGIVIDVAATFVTLRVFSFRVPTVASDQLWIKSCSRATLLPTVDLTRAWWCHRMSTTNSKHRFHGALQATDRWWSE